MESTDRIREDLEFLYGRERRSELLQRVSGLIDRYAAGKPSAIKRPHLVDLLTERDAILITYGDQIRDGDAPPLQTLGKVLSAIAGDELSGVHILPFYPYTSDDGFSVVNYKAVAAELGSWDDIRRLGERFRLMFDAVVNHISSQSRWFEGFVRGEQKYRDYFIDVDPDVDLSEVVRPRALPLLTEVEATFGTAHVWTTFSADQIDLNYANPEVLLEIIDVLLSYVRQGAQLIRLDAIAFAWKEVGTTCIHLPQTHRIVQVFRSVLDAVAPEVLLITETNVPHRENISYFGDGQNEAQLVYQFPLPPLVLHTLTTGDVTALSSWAAELRLPSRETTFFNFLASHDGVGLRPVEGILSNKQIEDLVRRVEQHGGCVSYRSQSDGSRIPYELNIVYFDAINDPYAGEPLELQIDRFMVSQAILLSLAGVPGIYIHSLLGSRNWSEGVELTGQNRTINRQKLDRERLEAELADPSTIRHQVLERYKTLLRARSGSPAFHPLGGQDVLDAGSAVFGLMRSEPAGKERVLCLHNVTGRPAEVTIPAPWASGVQLRDLITGDVVGLRDEAVVVPGYGVLWLSPD